MTWNIVYRTGPRVPVGTYKFSAIGLSFIPCFVLTFKIFRKNVEPVGKYRLQKKRSGPFMSKNHDIIWPLAYLAQIGSDKDIADKTVVCVILTDLSS